MSIQQQRTLQFVATEGGGGNLAPQARGINSQKKEKKAVFYPTGSRSQTVAYVLEYRCLGMLYVGVFVFCSKTTCPHHTSLLFFEFITLSENLYQNTKKKAEDTKHRKQIKTYAVSRRHITDGVSLFWLSRCRRVVTGRDPEAMRPVSNFSSQNSKYIYFVKSARVDKILLVLRFPPISNNDRSLRQFSVPTVTCCCTYWLNPLRNFGTNTGMRRVRRERYIIFFPFFLVSKGKDTDREGILLPLADQDNLRGQGKKLLRNLRGSAGL